MKLHSLRIEGLRKHSDTTIYFGASTFLIGKNNIGKSTVFKALEYLLTDKAKIDSDDDFFSILNEEGTDNIRLTDTVILTAEFRDVPEEAKDWRGLKGRIFEYDKSSSPTESGYCIFYKKTFEKGKNVKIEMKELKRTMKECFASCRTLNDYISNGIDESLLKEVYPDLDMNKNLTVPQKTQISKSNIDELFELESDESWFENPGGIAGNVLSRLPNFLLIPAQDKTNELSASSGALLKTLGTLFDDVRDASPHYQEAQKHLNLLQEELDPTDETKEFGKMMKDLNGIIDDVFPQTKLIASANLTDPQKSIKPIFDVKMSNNVNTPIDNQGTGVIRSAVFAMLRYRNMRENAHTNTPLIIAFEEPEIYLHPNAAHQLRDTIYELASTSNSQIVCTTHSPFMIDLGKRTEQILNHFSTKIEDSEGLVFERIIANPFNISEAFKNLHVNDKSYVKMIVKMDDYMAKIFFTDNVLIIEGDTEDIVIRETLERMPNEVRKDILHNWHIVKARGKSSIISLVKYFNAMGIKPYVIHDKDEGKDGAVKFNEPILSVVGEERLFVLVNCVEDILGYQAPNSEKPFKAFSFINANWNNDWESVTENWRNLMENIFSSSFSKQKDPTTKTVRRRVGITKVGQEEVEAELVTK